MARLKEKYRSEQIAALKKQFNYKNTMQVPAIKKIVVNMGLGEALQNAKAIEMGEETLRAITGQKPVVEGKAISQLDGILNSKGSRGEILA